MRTYRRRLMVGFVMMKVRVIIDRFKRQETRLKHIENIVEQFNLQGNNSISMAIYPLKGKHLIIALLDRFGNEGSLYDFCLY